MKTSLRYYLLLALLLVGLGSCEKLTEGYDINPNAPRTPQPTNS
ncbi:hypothetical protein [Hymenobacter qilianensis]|nr:hypothetical protein [Hymenobacter qilianensis]